MGVLSAAKTRSRSWFGTVIILAIIPLADIELEFILPADGLLARGAKEGQLMGN
jgi:hypothetical protein